MIFISDLWPAERAAGAPGSAGVLPGMCKQEWQALIYCLHSRSRAHPRARGVARNLLHPMQLPAQSPAHEKSEPCLRAGPRCEVFTPFLIHQSPLLIFPSLASQTADSSFCPVDSAGMKCKCFHKANVQTLGWNVKQKQFSSPNADPFFSAAATALPWAR